VIISDILDIVNKFPDKFQAVLLEILLKNALDSGLKTQLFGPITQPIERISDFIIPIDVRAFFIQYNLNEDLLKQLFYIENNQVSSIWRLKTTKKAVAQIQIALLSALENALKTGKFEFSYNSVRDKCKERMVYDANNYSSNFKYNDLYFKSFEDKEHIALSPDGKANLANVILEITKA